LNLTKTTACDIFFTLNNNADSGAHQGRHGNPFGTAESLIARAFATR
jgi:hypothetical protein